MENASHDNYLRSLIVLCLDSHCSPDARLRNGTSEPLPEDASKDITPDEAYSQCKDRLGMLVKDICDYGVRRDYKFPIEKRTPMEEKELSWLEGASEWLIAPERRRKKTTRGRNEVVPPPFEPEVRRLSLGSCVMALIEAISKDSFPEWLVRWISLDMGYNLDWLIFGSGPMLAEWKTVSGVEHSLPPSGTSIDPETGDITYENVTYLRERQEMSLWTFTDWQWLHNLRAMVKATYKAPTTPLLSRLTAWWRVPSQLPQMPHILAWVDWLAVWCTHEFIEGTPAEGWKQDIIEQMAVSRNSCLLLLGIGGQSGFQYRSGKSEPTVSVVRLAWMVRIAIERRGREGFLQYLDLANDEAVVRGFENLKGVFEARNWSTPERPFRSRVEHSKDENPDKIDLAGRNIPWGVPSEAKLEPLQLIAAIMDGSLPCDEEPAIAWIDKDAAKAAGQNTVNTMPAEEDEDYGA